MATARNSVGIIELSAIHKGFEVQDAVLKNANVDKLVARTICSGKYLVLVRGGVADVADALRVAKDTGAYAVISAIAVDNVDPAVLSAIVGATAIESAPPEAVLIVETFSVASAIKAADACVKEAAGQLLRVHLAMAIGGKAFFVMTGTIDDLKSARTRALELLKDDGMLVGTSLIPSPHADVLREMI
jgi:microcompartment protein CcmL/EutN